MAGNPQFVSRAGVGGFSNDINAPTDLMAEMGVLGESTAIADYDLGFSDDMMVITEKTTGRV